MKRFISLMLALALLVGCMAILSGCGNSEDEGAQFRIYLGASMYDFDPTDYYVSKNAEQVMSLLFEPLFRLDDDGDLKYAMAEDYDIDEKDRKITIYLRESEWSNGMPVQAEEYVSAWRDIILDANNANPAASLFFDIEGAVDVSNMKDGVTKDTDLGLETDGTNKIVITYREGADTEQLLKNLASIAASPVCKSVSSKPSAMNTWTKFIDTFVCNGPFKVKMMNYTDGTFTLERNKGYHQYTAELIDFTEQVTPFMMFANFESIGKISYSQIENNTIFYMGDATLAERAKYKDEAIVSYMFSTYTYVFNTTDETSIISIPEVRYALSLAIDREAIIEKVVFGKAATGFIPDVVDKELRKDNAVLSTKANEAKAKQLLSAANLAGLDTTIELVINNDEESLAIAAIIESSWEKLGYGIAVEVKPVDVTETPKYVYSKDADDNPVVEKLQEELVDENGDPVLDENGDPILVDVVDFRDSTIQEYVKRAALFNEYNFDVIAVDWQMFTNDAFVALASLTQNYGGYGKYFESTDGVSQWGENGIARNNMAGWNNEAYEKLIDDAYKATDAKTRNEKLRAAEKLLMEQAPVIPIMYNCNFAFINRELDGVKVSGHGHFVFTKADLKLWDSENQTIKK